MTVSLTADQAADPVLRLWGGPDFAPRIAETAPGLHEMIVKRWRAARLANQPDSQFRKELDGALRDLFDRGVTRIPSEAARDWGRVRLKLAETLQQQGDHAACTDLFNGKLGKFEKDKAVRRAQDHWFATAIITGMQFKKPAETSYRIAGSTIEAVINDTGLSEQTVRDGLQQKGSDRALCAVQTSLLRTALRLNNKEGRNLLRHL